MEALQFIGSLQKCGRVCRGGVSSCASHPLRLLVLLVALFSFGWGNAAYAETYYWYHGLTTKSTLTVTATTSVWKAADYSFTANGENISGAVKLDSDGSVTFETKNPATVTLGISTKKRTEGTKASQSYVKFDNEATECVLTQNEGADSYTPKEITISGVVAAGEHTITKGGTEMGIYYIKVVETPTAPTADFTYGSTKWTSPTENEMTITVPSHKGGKTFDVTLNISDGANATCSEDATLNGNTLTITAPASTESAVAVQTTTVTLTKDNATTTYN